MGTVKLRVSNPANWTCHKCGNLIRTKVFGIHAEIDGEIHLLKAEVDETCPACHEVKFDKTPQHFGTAEEAEEYLKHLLESNQIFTLLGPRSVTIRPAGTALH